MTSEPSLEVSIGKISDGISSSTKVTLSLLVEAEMQMQQLCSKDHHDCYQLDANDKIEDYSMSYARLSTEKTRLIQLLRR